MAKSSIPKVEQGHLSLDDIHSNPAQPPHRTSTGKALKDLADDIAHNGLAEPIYVARIDGEYTAINGHRRMAAYRLLGKRDIPCRIINGATSLEDATNRFAALARVTCKLSCADAFYGWLHAPNRASYLQSISKSQSHRIRSFVDILGEKRSEEYAARMIDPSISTRAVGLARFIALYTKTPKPDVILTWLIKHRMGLAAHILTQSGGKRQALSIVSKIEQDKPYNLRPQRMRVRANG